MWKIKQSYIKVKMKSIKQRSKHMELRFHKIKELVEEEKN